mgnify:CR=1 FL=1
MFGFLNNAWALLLGVLLLMIGNGLQGTLLGVRGSIEGFSTFEMSVVMSAYFLGFLFASRVVPNMIRNVGHVRVFAALASFISAVLILYPTLANPWIWAVGRVVIGFCFCGVYITAESWLNAAATNETRGKALSLYMLVQVVGIVIAQGLLLVADPGGFVLFVIPSILVSIAVAPILLAASPTPSFDTTKPMSLKRLWEASPLGCMGMFLLGGVFSAQFGMASVWGTQAGLSVKEISIFVAFIYVGGLVLQYPIGWFSDRMDRRLVIMIVAAAGGIFSLLAMFFDYYFGALLVAAFVIGGTSNPLYSLLIAYTNDYLDPDDMAAASGGLIFINGMGAIAGPLVTGWMMDSSGAQAFFGMIALLMLILAGYAVYRMTQRSRAGIEDGAYAPVLPSASPVAVEVASEYYIETALEDETNET